jgi:hypothetical protein
VAYGRIFHAQTFSIVFLPVLVAWPQPVHSEDFKLVVAPAPHRLIDSGFESRSLPAVVKMPRIF